jgi:hypothetical protein
MDLDCIAHYEYVPVYVDDLMCTSTHLERFFKSLTKTYNYKLKGVNPPINLRSDMFRDPYGRGDASYIKKMDANYDVRFRSKPIA